MSDCQKEQEPFFQCCCGCVFHKPDHDYLNLKPKGWICDNPEVGAISGWEEHSVGCEMHTTKEQFDILRKPFVDFERRYNLIDDVYLYVKCCFRHLRNRDSKNVRWSIRKMFHYTKILFREWNNASTQNVSE